MPQRIQLRRTAGWRKPPGAVVVARPTRWGNPFAFRAALAGHDLACWCPLDGPCHADVLLEIANG